MKTGTKVVVGVGLVSLAAAVAIGLTLGQGSGGKLSLRITGDTTIDFGSTEDYAGVASGGTPPYTYAWGSDGDNWTTLSTDSVPITGDALGDYPLYFRVIDAVRAAAVASIVISVVCGPNSPCSHSCPNGSCASYPTPGGFCYNGGCVSCYPGIQANADGTCPTGYYRDPTTPVPCCLPNTLVQLTVSSPTSFKFDSTTYPTTSGSVTIDAETGAHDLVCPGDFVDLDERYWLLSAVNVTGGVLITSPKAFPTAPTSAAYTFDLEVTGAGTITIKYTLYG